MTNWTDHISLPDLRKQYWGCVTRAKRSGAFQEAESTVAEASGAEL